MPDIQLIPRSEFVRVAAAGVDADRELALIADMCRFNTLSAVKRAGSGHLGTSFSAMDIVVWLYYRRMNTARVGVDHPDRDLYFSSKGHDVPGLYSVLCSLGILPEEKLLALRRFGGLDGHPDVGTAGIEASSGSLGMGISKGQGMAWAKRRLGREGRVFVMLGDGELQEGQNYEGLHAAAHHLEGNLTVIVDHNRVQSDQCVSEIIDLGDLSRLFETSSWRVARADGHDFASLDAALEELDRDPRSPKAIIAETIKGRGVSFMEHPAALESGGGFYRWHAGAPDDASFEAATRELRGRIGHAAERLGVSPLRYRAIAPDERDSSNLLAFQNSVGEPVSLEARERLRSKPTDEYVVEAYGDALVAFAVEVPELVVLDADLAADCRLRKFQRAHPDRFIEVGIAEQHMVSMAAGLARLGLLPVVNSFSSFLASRANEQIYNAVTERGRFILACHYSGLIPAGPGKSHQSIRDISLLAALPGLEILQPANAVETRAAVEYCLLRARGPCALRLVIGPSPRAIDLGAEHRLVWGQGTALAAGDDAILFGYGPVMLHEALVAREALLREGFGLTVVALPWLNRVDPDWLARTISPFAKAFVVEDHSPVGGLGQFLLTKSMELRLLEGRTLDIFGVEGMPACGTPMQALAYHGLDGESLARRILAACRGDRT